MRLGVCYFPEHWPSEEWERDVAAMADAGLEYVRMAEFSWGVLEPERGTFDFEWLDEAIELIGDHGMQAVLCTPTATPPKWLVDERPSIRQRRPRRNRPRTRQPPALLFQLRRLPRGDSSDRRAGHRAIRRLAARRRLADGQRVRLSRDRPVLLRRLCRRVPNVARGPVR